MAEIKRIERLVLSGSTNGRGILITGTNTSSANTIHTTSSTSGVVDEIWLYCYNSGSGIASLYLCLGGTTSPDDIITMIIPPNAGDVLVLEGECFAGGVVIKAYSNLSGYLVIRGFVNRIYNE